MQLHGTLTSPFVRRVRIVAMELGVPIELVRSDSEDGQTALRATTPLWMVPVARFDDGVVVWDSDAIVRSLFRRYGHGPLRPPSDSDQEANRRSAIDGALNSAVNLFQIRRDGGDVDGVAYLRKQRARIDEALGWVEAQIVGTSFTDDLRPGLDDVALVTMLDWMVFRDVWPVGGHPTLEATRARWNQRPVWAETAPR